MLASFPSAALRGIDAFRVDVEVDVSGGLPVYVVVGLPATSIKEGATRIRSALKNCGHDLPPSKVTVSLAPADVRKEGAAFDLPIAIGMVVAGGVFLGEAVAGLLLAGELGLDGSVRPVRGVLAMAARARAEGLRGVVVPAACAAEASAVPGLRVHGVEHLSQILTALAGAGELPLCTGRARPRPARDAEVDFAEVRGQAMARRAVEIAVAGGHNLLLYGPPGTGKTMIARRVPTILPPMTRDEAIEVTRVYSAAGLSSPDGLVEHRPFRAPHHSISASALVGGGTHPRPGEISLAHRGVLFLDELPEFPRAAIESLRQPLEDRVVRVSRVQGSVLLPASFFLVGSANPCACGWFGSPERACTCGAGTLERYRGRLSGPILDRIDLQVPVRSVPLEEMRAPDPGEPSAAIRARVVEARARQARRLARFGARVNAEMSLAAVRKTCALDAAGECTLAAVHAKRHGMSARALDRILRAARTIADLDGRDAVAAGDLLEAAAYRALELDWLGDRPCRSLARFPAG